MKVYQMPIILLKSVWKSDNIQLSYSKIGSKITDMLESPSQSIACDFAASQVHWNVPSWVYSIAACGWAYSLSCPSKAVGSPFVVYIIYTSISDSDRSNVRRSPLRPCFLFFLRFVLFPHLWRWYDCSWSQSHFLSPDTDILVGGLL